MRRGRNVVVAGSGDVVMDLAIAPSLALAAGLAVALAGALAVSVVCSCVCPQGARIQYKCNHRPRYTHPDRAQRVDPWRP